MKSQTYCGAPDQQIRLGFFRLQLDFVFWIPIRGPFFIEMTAKGVHVFGVFSAAVLLNQISIYQLIFLGRATRFRLWGSNVRLFCDSQIIRVFWGIQLKASRLGFRLSATRFRFLDSCTWIHVYTRFLSFRFQTDFFLLK